MNKEVRDYFMGRINKIIDGKIKAINDSINMDTVKGEALTRFLNQKGVLSLYTDYINKYERKRKLEKELDDMRSQFKEKVGRWVNSDLSDVTSMGETACLEEVMAERNPDAHAKLAELERAKQDVYGAVLLATSEPKLVASLVAVLAKYGDDMKEVVALLQ